MSHRRCIKLSGNQNDLAVDISQTLTQRCHNGRMNGVAMLARMEAMHGPNNMNSQGQTNYFC